MFKVGLSVMLLCGSFGLFAKGECRQEMKEKCFQHRGDRDAMKSCIAEQISEDCREKVKKKMRKKRRANRNSEE